MHLALPLYYAPAPAPAPAPQALVQGGTYEIGGERVTISQRLGKGGFATAWRARTQAGDEVAVKAGRKEPATAEEYVHLARCACARVPELFATDDELIPGHVVSVQELVPGEALFDALQRPGTATLSFQEAAERTERLWDGMVDAVRTVHSRGTIHRDAHLRNMFGLLAAPESCKLGDFGLACDEAALLDKDVSGDPRQAEGARQRRAGDEGACGASA